MRQFLIGKGKTFILLYVKCMCDVSSIKIFINLEIGNNAEIGRFNIIYV